jgi:preprotein translocase subunit SecF
VHQHPELTIDKAVNRAVNETLGRTILTSLCTFLVVAALWLVGGKVIEDFAFTLMIGIVVGTYSSIFIASSLVIMITHYNERREARMKATGVTGKRRGYVVRPEPKLT